MENLSLIPFAVFWGLLALTVFALVLVRRKIASDEDAGIHVTEGDARLIPHQQEIAHKLEVIDKWGKLATIVAVAWGVLVAALWVYQTWVNSGSAALH